MDKPIKERVLKALEEILNEPRRGSWMVFRELVCCKWRVSDYRLIHRLDELRRMATFIVFDHRSRVNERYRL